MPGLSEREGRAAIMRTPKMILFDYGQTLADEERFDGIKGTKAVLQYAIKNKYHHTAVQVQARADQMNSELGRFDPARRHLLQVEIPNHMFTAYLYESMGIELSLTAPEIDRIFWDAAASGVPTHGIETFLDFLKEQGIRTGVISNIAYCGEIVEERIRTLLPGHTFEFILASSEYMFRKPNRRIFDLALEKAGLGPEDVWYIGDNYECDVVGAREAGLFPVWYIGAAQSPVRKCSDVLTVSHWSQLIYMLEESIPSAEYTPPAPVV